jgi:hypothetical protein
MLVVVYVFQRVITVPIANITRIDLNKTIIGCCGKKTKFPLEIHVYDTLWYSFTLGGGIYFSGVVEVKVESSNLKMAAFQTPVSSFLHG